MPEHAYVADEVDLRCVGAHVDEQGCARLFTEMLHKNSHNNILMPDVSEWCNWNGQSSRCLMMSTCMHVCALVEVHPGAPSCNRTPEIAELTRQTFTRCEVLHSANACLLQPQTSLYAFAIETLVIALDTTQKIIGGTKPAHPGTTLGSEQPAVAPDEQHTQHSRYVHRCYADVHLSIPRLAGSQFRSHAVWPFEVSRRQSDMGSSRVPASRVSFTHTREIVQSIECSMDLLNVGLDMQQCSAMCPCAQAAVSRSLKFKTRSYHQPTARSTSPACPCEHGATHSPWKQRSSGDVEI